MSFEIRVYTHIMTYLHDRLRTVPKIQEYAYEGTEFASAKFANFFKANYLSDNPIGVRTGRLRGSVKPVVRKQGKSIKGGISWGGQHIPYAFVHINRKVGMPTYIGPVKRNYLALPIGININKEYYKSPLDMTYSILRFPYIGYFEGRSFVPFFQLRKHVRIFSKVGVDDVMEVYRPIFMNDVMSVVKERIRREKRKK